MWMKKIRNRILIRQFGEGVITGKSYSLFIKDDYLYSWTGDAPIAARCKRKDGSIYFKISNNAASLGGDVRSCSTSSHIRLVHSDLQPNILVEGWAEKSKLEWKRQYTHKTIGGCIKAFVLGYSDIFTENHYISVGGASDNNISILLVEDKPTVWQKHCYRYAWRTEDINKDYLKCPEQHICPAKFSCFTSGDSFNATVFFVEAEPEGNGKAASAIRKHCNPRAVITR